ncbi:MAG: TRAP transporter small permease subunit [Wenzhouxiangella sp.]|nr:TRAP transporter small permease subunit [Wenzhouxiangella sp.]MCH8479230.1 TRAP transporter small permease [Wenzhouxiangella sp.]
MNKQTAKRTLTFLTGTERIVATVAFALMVLVSASDVALRELTGQGLDGAREAAVLLMVVLVLTGFGLATASGRQLRPRFADGLVPQNWQPGLKRVADVLTALTYLLLAIIAAVLVSQSIALGEQTPVLRLPSALIQAALPLAFATGALRHLVFAVHPNLRPGEDLMLVAPGREKEA